MGASCSEGRSASRDSPLTVACRRRLRDPDQTAHSEQGHPPAESGRGSARGPDVTRRLPVLAARGDGPRHASRRPRRAGRYAARRTSVGSVAATAAPAGTVPGLPPPRADLPAERLEEHVDGAADALRADGCRRLVAWRFEQPPADAEALFFGTAEGARAVLRARGRARAHARPRRRGPGVGAGRLLPARARARARLPRPRRLASARRPRRPRAGDRPRPAGRGSAVTRPTADRRLVLKRLGQAGAVLGASGALAALGPPLARPVPRRRRGAALRDLRVGDEPGRPPLVVARGSDARARWCARPSRRSAGWSGS